MEETKYRLRDFIDKIDQAELSRIKKDLEAGGIHLKKFIDQKIKENEKKHEQYCSVCSSPIDPASTDTYTLIFGPSDFKKKATFCAMDCLKYFLKNMEEMKQQNRKIAQMQENNRI